jgi:leader peptidase (prepilin peptidase)/N-methyltransferase
MIAMLADPAAFAAVAGLFGLMVGSFLNVVIHRLPKMMEQDWQCQCAELRGEDPPVAELLTLAIPRSRCPHCGHQITALENIPILSWLMLRGKCSACSAPISMRYPVVEAVTGILTAFAAWHFGFGWSAAGAILFVWAMVALTGIDFDTQLLPDSITLPLSGWACSSIFQAPTLRSRLQSSAPSPATCRCGRFIGASS